MNFCSTAMDMLLFSTQSALSNAGTGEFDYVVVTWNPSPDVEEWLESQRGLYRARYETDESLDYVPNLRKMMSFGFDEGYKLNDYVAIVNTDMAFGRDWLLNLARRATPDVIPNSVHVTPVKAPFIVTADLGVPTSQTFAQAKWNLLHDRLFEAAKARAIKESRDMVLTPADRGGDWRSCATMPYVLHRKWWDAHGPWEPNLEGKSEAPDRRFFGRCADAGAQFILCEDSICYHHEAVERRGARRPIGVESMKAGL